jgi:limonene-1,2-epoxide hydrolase
VATDDAAGSALQTAGYGPSDPDGDACSGVPLAMIDGRSHTMTEVSRADGAGTELVRGLWAALARRDFDAVGSYLAPDGHYVDVAVKDIEPGARGPEQTAARLRLGLAPLHAYELHDGPIVASGGYVVTEHSETWTWEPGVSVTLPFVSVMQVAGGKVDRWWDYFDLATLTNAAPRWWLDHIAAGYR